jgi:hypothetical protein
MISESLPCQGAPCITTHYRADVNALPISYNPITWCENLSSQPFLPSSQSHLRFPYLIHCFPLLTKILGHYRLCARLIQALGTCFRIRPQDCLVRRCRARPRCSQRILSRGMRWRTQVVLIVCYGCGLHTVACSQGYNNARVSSCLDCALSTLLSPALAQFTSSYRFSVSTTSSFCRLRMYLG